MMSVWFLRRILRAVYLNNKLFVLDFDMTPRLPQSEMDTFNVLVQDLQPFCRQEVLLHIEVRIDNSNDLLEITYPLTFKVLLKRLVYTVQTHLVQLRYIVNISYLRVRFKGNLDIDFDSQILDELEDHWFKGISKLISRADFWMPELLDSPLIALVELILEDGCGILDHHVVFGKYEGKVIGNN